MIRFAEVIALLRLVCLSIKKYTMFNLYFFLKQCIVCIVFGKKIFLCNNKRTFLNAYMLATYSCYLQ